MPSEGLSLGEQLMAAGWRQGCLLPASAPLLFVERVSGPPPRWAERSREVDGFLVLATQTCDLKRHTSEEPTVEFLRAFWTGNQRIVVPAGRNAVRHFLLREGQGEQDKQGLIAEAAKRVFVDKRSLLLFNPEQGCAPQREGQFRRWLARRYDRPAIPDAIALGVQKPVVEALRAAPVDARVWTLLRGVREVMYDTEQRNPPFKVKLLLVREDALVDVESLSDADAEELAAWFSSVLAATGDAEIDEWEVTDTANISLRDYLTVIPLALDEYSL